jgi:hypothetical protein
MMITAGSFMAWIEITAATIAFCILFGAVARYIATVNALDVVVTEQRPVGRARFPFTGQIWPGRESRSDTGYHHVILGTSVLQCSDPRYQALLLRARICLGVCALSWAVFLIALALYFRNGI